MSSLADRWYAALVRLFPSGFRVAFGREVQAVILEQRAKLSGAGLRRQVWFHVAETADLLRAAGVEWRPTVLRLTGAILLVAAIANVGYDLANPKLSMGVIAWGMTFIAIGTSRLMTRAAERRRRPG